MKKLTFYLFNPSVRSFDDLLKPAKLGPDGYHELPLSERATSLGFNFKLYVEENKSKPPKWISFVQEYTTSSLDEMKNTVNSFVVLVNVPDGDNSRYFAVTGGFGFNALNKDNVELNFGLITTLNSIDPQKLKFLDAKNIDVRTKQKRIMSNVSTEVFDFGINFDQELVRIVSGYCADPAVGKKISGADSLSLSSEINLSQLGDKCIQLLAKYKEETYKTNFDFIDNILPIKDKTLISSLDQKLIESLSAYDFDSGKLAIAYPDQIEYERCNFYKVYGTGQRSYEIEEVDAESFKAVLQSLDIIDVDTLKAKAKIVGFEEEGRPALGSETLYGFLVYETEIDGTVYILSNKKWFKVDRDYVTQVNQKLRSNVVSIDTFLSDWQNVGGEYKEGTYNSTYSTDPDYLVMDKDFFQMSKSRSKIEVADLYQKPAKRLICVKKLSASSTLSHLFAQGSVSIDLLRNMPEYKVCYESKLREKWADADVNVEDVKLTYAVGTKKEGDVLDIIPFFSKLNLLHHVDFIRKFGVIVEITKIKII